MERIAVIDLGSNSIRMTITRLFPDGSHRMVETARAMVRLSEGMGEACLLRSEPMERTLHALGLFRRLMDAHHVTQVYPVATAAVRQAVNAADFLALAEQRTGLVFQVITGEEEAELDFLGVVNTLSLPDFAMIDIGGASTEIAVIRSRALVGKISVPWGAVNLTERFELQGKPSKRKREAAEEAVRKHLRSCAWLLKEPALPLIGLGGTVRALAKSDRKKRGWPIEALHGYEISADRLTDWLDEWNGLNAEARRNLPGIGKERADILDGAVLPLRMLLSQIGSQRIVVSGNGIREGLFYRHLARTRGWRGEIVGDVRAHAVENLMLLHEANGTHARHVRHLAWSLFDKLLPVHGMGTEARELLGHAALLHDTGMHIDYYNHQQHGFYLLLNSELNGFTHREKALLALLVGMHRVNAELRTEWKTLECVLSDGDKPLLRRLSIFLMLAEQLDRGEVGVVQDVLPTLEPRRVLLEMNTGGDARLEREAAELCAPLFEKEFSRQLILMDDNETGGND